MGTTTFVNRSTTRTGKPRPLHLGIDVPLVVSVISLLVIGLMAVFSSSSDWSFIKYDFSGYMVLRQTVFAIVGLVAGGIVMLMDYHIVRRFAVWILLGTLGILFVLVIVGSGTVGKRAIFDGSIQPSELAKLMIVLYLSVWLHSKREYLSSVTLGLIPLGTIIGATASLILLQTDISAALTVVVLGAIMFFIGGGDLRQIILIVLMVGLLAFLAVTLFERGRERVDQFTQGFSDPMAASYHLQRAMEAIVRGGFFGVGIGNGITKHTGLPVPWTDSIFAVIAEETGLFGCLIIAGLYVVIIWRGIRIALRAPDMLGALMAGGLSIWIGMEAAINIAVLVNLVPFAGNALPLISYGGSSLVTTLIALGIIASIGRHASLEHDEKEGSIFSAVVDLRRRDRRRRVSRRNRPQSSAE